MIERMRVCVMVMGMAMPALGATREREELERVEADAQRMDRELMALRVKLMVAEPGDKPALQGELHKKNAERVDLMKKLSAATLTAYLADEKPDDKINAMMSDTLRAHMQADRWEEASDFATAMASKGHPDPRTLELAGVSAFQANRFEEAGKHLDAARKAGSLTRDGQRLLGAVPGYIEQWKNEQRLRQAEAQANDLPRVRLETTAGNIDIELFENQAPGAVANFVYLVGSGFYNGTVFHRVLEGFMAQGGDPTGTGRGGPGWSIKCECYRDDYRRHFRGTLSMAHAGRDTGGSQFFLTFVPTPHLDGRHTAFGRVIEGMDVLANITRRDPDSDVEPTKIVRATVLRKRNYDYVPEKLPSRR